MHKRRRRHDFLCVRFAKLSAVYTFEKDFDEEEMDAVRDQLWYSRQDFHQFRQDMAQLQEQEPHDPQKAQSVAHALLKVYGMLREAGNHQRYQFYYEDAELWHLLNKAQCSHILKKIPDEWVGMEARAHVDIERDFFFRRAHLMEEVQGLQECCLEEQRSVPPIRYHDNNNYYDGFVVTQPSSGQVEDAERHYGYLICQSSRLTSRASRLFAHYVATMLAKSVAADNHHHQDDP